MPTKSRTASVRMSVIRKSTTMSRSSKVIRLFLLSISLLFLLDNERSANNGFGCFEWSGITANSNSWDNLPVLERVCPFFFLFFKFNR